MAIREPNGLGTSTWAGNTTLATSAERHDAQAEPSTVTLIALNADAVTTFRRTP
jgi:hypothetical protein